MSDDLVVTLVQLTDDERADWVTGALERLVERRVAAGESAARASSQAANQREASFPGGAVAPGHHAMAVHVGDERVGAIWISPGASAGGPERFVVILEIDDAHRVDAVLAATVRAAERWAADDGATRLVVSVFGPDAELQSSYATLGYQVGATSMFKLLA
jgi:hypothetical protein